MEMCWPLLCHTPINQPFGCVIVQAPRVRTQTCTSMSLQFKTMIAKVCCILSWHSSTCIFLTVVSPLCLAYFHTAGAAAWARPCLFHEKTNRPVVGNANICPYALYGSDPDQIVAIVAHELIHALVRIAWTFSLLTQCLQHRLVCAITLHCLPPDHALFFFMQGFTNSLFNMFVHPSNLTRLSTANVVKSVNVGGRTVQRIITPGVVREARAQFGCPTLDGAQLEEEGGDGSAGSHWEYTHYQVGTRICLLLHFT